MKGFTLLALAAFLFFATVVAAQDTAKPTAPAPASPAGEEKTKTEDKDPAFDAAWIMIKQGVAAMKKLRDFTAIFHKQEYAKGKMRPKEIASMKFRMKPRSVYMKWIGKEKKDQEVIWQKGWNDNDLKAHKGSFPDITVNLNPKGRLAKADNRHPVTEAGFPHTVQLIASNFNRIRKNMGDGSKIVDLGEQNILGAKARCFESHLPKDKNPKYYMYKSIICSDLKTKLPVKVQIWDKEDGKVRLVETYVYEKVKINVGLTDADFDPENKEYDF